MEEIKKPQLLRPVPSKYGITSPFTWNRKLMVDGKLLDRPHHGIDFGCPIGTPIRAVGTGKITRVGWENEANKKQGYGLRVWQEISNELGIFYIVYAHLSQTLVIEEARILQGEVIALSGNSGASTGPHLHLGARKNNSNEYVDMDFFE